MHPSTSIVSKKVAQTHGFSDLIPEILIDVKRKELIFLASLCGDSARLPALPSFQDCLTEKMRLRALIKRRSIPYNDDFESSLDLSRPKSWAGMEFNFNYQRLGFLNSDLTSHTSLYGENQSHSSQLLWTSSCQQAISCLLMSASQKGIKIVCPWGAYWETISFIENFLNCPLLLEKPRQSWILYLDSSVWPVGRQLDFDVKLCEAIVFDTTCFARKSSRIQEVIEFAKMANVPLFLIRSHQKLDCLGMEFGRLGSVLFLDFSFEKTSKEKSKSLLYALSEIGRWFALFPNYTQVYPFMFNEEFTSLNSQWIERVKRNQILINGALEDLSWTKPIVFDHGLYFYLRFKMDLSEQEFEDIKTSLSRRLIILKIPSQFVASYPWDFVALTGFKQNHSFFPEKRRSHTLRVSVGDIGEKLALDFAYHLKIWAEKFDHLIYDRFEN